MTSLPDETAPGAADRSDPVALLATRARGALRDAPAPGGTAPSGSGCAPVAAVRCGDGSIYLGRSFHSRTEGLGVCALRVALTRAIAEGHPPATHALLAWPDRDGAEGGDPQPSTDRALPSGRCGLGPCMQSLLALAPGATLVRIEGDAAPELISLAAALPGPFASFEPEEGS